MIANKGLSKMSGNENYETTQASPMSMRMPYSNDGGGAMYSPIMPPPLPAASSSPSLTPTYQPSGGVSDGLVIVQQPSMDVGGSAGGGGGGGGGGEMVVKRGRGRPRKYSPNGPMAALASPRPKPVALPAAGENGLSSGKKARGRPPGSVNKQPKKHKVAATFAASGLAGMGFTPYVIDVKAGEDVLAKLMAFSQHTTNIVCILSANGSISNVTILQQATSGGTVTYEGRFEILALCGSFMVSDIGGQRGSRSCCLSVSLAGPDGRVLGGGVAGLLTAASPVQIIVGTFIAAGQNVYKPVQYEAALGQTNFPSGGTSGGGGGGSLSESSGGGGSGSPLGGGGGGQSNNSNPHGGHGMHPSWR